MSTPEMCEYTLPGTSTPIISGRNWAFWKIWSAGIRPALMISWSWYTSWMKRLSAVTRCTRPSSMLLPFLGRNDAGNEVKGNQALGARAVFVFGAVHRKGDANAPKDHFGLFTPGRHHLFGVAAPANGRSCL
jgi:hypothetical protein